MKEKKIAFSRFLILWSGEFISSIGSGISSFGLSIYIYQQTGKVSYMAIATLLAFLPSLLLSIPSGVLADRYDRRILMIVGDSLSALGLVFILFFLLQGRLELWHIYIGISISSIFSSLLEPAYKASITDVLDVEQYAKASGLVQIAGSSKYLISPILAGILLTNGGLVLILCIDIGTFFITFATTLFVRKGICSTQVENSHNFIKDMKEGWRLMKRTNGILSLCIMSSLITFCVGIIQTLTSPLLLSFSNSVTLGMITSIIAMGMLVSSILIGIFDMQKHYVRYLSGSLFLAGCCMVLFGMRENIVCIGIAGFLFFAMLPYANTSLEVLLRKNIENTSQGRAWGFIGLITQLGYVVAYICSGILADAVFTPLLVQDGLLSHSVGLLIGTGEGRGIAFFIILAGIMLSVVALLLYRIKSIRELESV